jgi:CHAT domain-containing protein
MDAHVRRLKDDPPARNGIDKTSHRSLGIVGVAALFALGALSESISGQSGSRAQRLQADGIAKIDHWTNYVRRTGDAKGTVGELAAAESDLRTSLDLYLKDKDYAGAAWSTIKLGNIKQLRSEFNQAATDYQTAIELAQRANRIDYETKALARIAYVELQLDRMDAAKDHSRQAMDLGVNCGNKAFYFEALDVAGETEIKLGNLVAAGEFLDRALAMSAEVEDKQQLYMGYMDRADIYYNLAAKCDYQRYYDVCYHSLDRAREDYRKGLAITDELGYQFISKVFNSLLKDLDEREALLRGTQRSSQTLGDTKLFSPHKAGDVLVTESFAAGSSSPQDLAFFEAAFKQLQDWRSRLRQQGLTTPDLNPSELQLEGQLAQMKGNDEAALAAFLHSVDLLEKDRRNLRDEQARGTFLEDKIGFYYQPALILLDQKRYAEAFALFEKSRSRAMADMLASRPLNLGTVQERTLFSQLQTLRFGIAAQQQRLFNLAGSKDRDQHISEIVQIEKLISAQQQQYQELERRIAREAPNLRQLISSDPVTLESVMHSAREGAYDVFYYVVQENVLVLWHINGSGVQVKNVFLPRIQLAGKTAGLQKLLLARKNAADEKFDTTYARELFLFLIQPVRSAVTNNHLVIIPHEELNSLPFQVLQSPETGKFLGEEFAISYAPSATVLESLQTRPNLRKGRLLAVADPGIHDAKEEVEAIGRLYPAQSKVVTQAPASKEDIKTWVGDYDLVHLSVHGKFNASDPLLSYLQFREVPPDNGRLTAADMFGLPLQKNSVVVLSACETGRVEATHANEVLGMVRSLLYAGAGQLVLSSWQVDAASTRLWMETFYREGQSAPPAEAARRALLAVKSRPDYSHPFFWAPFLMTGK